MIKRKHSKLCIRRITSKSTLVSTDRHSTLCLRNTASKIHHRLRLAFRIFAKRSERQNYFTGQLPAEIRLLIYSYALCFDVPIRLDRNPPRGMKTKLAGILLACRLTYTEALPVLHELNTIVSTREEFCRFPTGREPQLSCKPDLVERLRIRDLAPSARCAARISNSAQYATPPCRVCSPSILGLVYTLSRQPRLEEVSIDYHSHNYAVRVLFEALRFMPHNMLGTIYLTCTGIGRYTLTGSLFRNTNFTLRDVPLQELWTRVIALPIPPPYLPFWRGNHRMWKDVKLLAKRTEKPYIVAMAMKLTVLIMHHDSGLIPASFTRDWPQNTAMDLRALDNATPELLHGLNVALQNHLEGRPAGLMDLVARP